MSVNIQKETGLLPLAGTGISNYAELENKPRINGVELVGNKSKIDLGIPVLITDLIIDTDHQTVTSQEKKRINASTLIVGDEDINVNYEESQTDDQIIIFESFSLTESAKNRINNKQDKITSDNKLPYNLISGTPTLGGAASKSVDTSIGAASTSANLPTSAAVASFVEGKGYKTTDTNTTYTFATGDSNGQIKVTPSGGTAQNVSVKGLGSLAYSNATIPTKASDIGAMASTVTHLSGDVPTTRKVNGKALSSDITLTASDVSALPSSTTIPTITDTYSATSSNGMSGKAVASAISGKQNTLATQTAYSAKGSATKVPQITTNSLGQVTGISEVTIEAGSTIRSFSSMADYQAHASEINEGDYFTIDDSEKPNVYSTTPVRIGTWIDGKGVYRVVVEGTTPSNNGTLLRIPDDNLGEILTMYGSILGKDSNTAMIGYSYSAYCSPYRVGRTNEVRINVSVNNLIGCPFRCVVEYIGLV